MQGLVSGYWFCTIPFVNNCRNVIFTLNTSAPCQKIYGGKMYPSCVQLDVKPICWSTRSFQYKRKHTHHGVCNFDCLLKVIFAVISILVWQISSSRRAAGLPDFQNTFAWRMFPRASKTLSHNQTANNGQQCMEYQGFCFVWQWYLRNELKFLEQPPVSIIKWSMVCSVKGVIQVYEEWAAAGEGLFQIFRLVFSSIETWMHQNPSLLCPLLQSILVVVSWRLTLEEYLGDTLDKTKDFIKKSLCPKSTPFFFLYHVGKRGVTVSQ